MEKEEIELYKKKWSSAKQQDPIDVANAALDDVPIFLSALEASQREAEELRKAIKEAEFDIETAIYHEDGLDGGQGEETLKLIKQALARTEKEGGG